MKKLLFLLSIAVLAFSDAQEVVRSQKETNAVQDLARQFAQRLKETREFRTKGDDLFIERFAECHLRAEIEGKENAIFMQIPASMPKEIVTEARREELQNYLIAQLNFYHLKTLYRISTRELEGGKWGDSFYTPEEDFPPGVYELLMKNPTIAAGAVNKNNRRMTISGFVQNVHELRSVLRTAEEAMSAMREYFKAHPPEDTEIYKKNMERIGNHPHHTKFWEVAFFKISDKERKESKEGLRCLGFSPRLSAIVKVPPFYRLFVLQDGKRFKIASMWCTEPPCVD